MVWPDDIAGTLVTEAVRGEGGRLYNAAGERFMQAYDPERMELSSRDRVALASYTEILEGRGSSKGAVMLDITHRGKDYILEKLPRMYRQFIEHQMLDISKEPMEVAPTAHYSMGGVVTDHETYATDVAGLYAAGEVTGGLHGANRLGGNSLSEAVNAGRRAGEAAAAFTTEGEVVVRSKTAIRAALDELDYLTKPGPELPRPLQRALRDLMWERCGVVRDEDGLRAALDGLAQIRAASDDADVRPGAEGWSDLANLLDLRAGLLAAEATVRGAIERRDTRGAHNRSDFPDRDPNLQVNFHARSRDGAVEVAPVDVAPIMGELREWIAEAPVYSVSDRLLE
jgi:succinate dehydrogenase / fumarate reductase flavoprotein subunit